jgi:hypothetical protein
MKKEGQRDRYTVEDAGTEETETEDVVNET